MRNRKRRFVEKSVACLVESVMPSGRKRASSHEDQGTKTALSRAESV